MPVSDSPARLKAYLLERCTVELLAATDCNFSFGYISEGNKKFSITSEIQLAEALSLVKKGIITLWVDPHLPNAKNSPISTLGKNEKVNYLEHHPSSQLVYWPRRQLKFRPCHFQLLCLGR